MINTPINQILYSQPLELRQRLDTALVQALNYGSL